MIRDYKTLPLDKNKRHLIVGDIHGKFDMLERLLETGKYDPANDIVYSVGDMIDRFPYSVEVVKFFTEQPNTRAILGNHEYMMIDSEWYETWMNNGGIETGESLRKHGLTNKWMTGKFTDIPLVLDVGEDGDPDSFRLIHAEMPYDWNEERLRSELKTMSREKLSNKLQWSRKTIHLYNSVDLNTLHSIAKDITERNVRNVFSGHTWTAKYEVTKIGNQTFLDTGYLKLSMIDALTGESWTINR